ncbi:uncharacterized protein LOC111123734 [Crassostrea virginica]
MNARMMTATLAALTLFAVFNLLHAQSPPCDYSMFPGANTSLPCPLECPCYKNKAPDDCFSYTELGYQLPCSRIDSNTTLKRSQNETSAAGVFEVSSVIGTCNRLAKYLDTWARQSDAMKQKIISFLSNPLDPNITYQDIDQMPLAAFAVANKSLWRDVLKLATDRQKLSIQMKIMMSNDCEVQSMLKGLNFTDLYLKSQSKGEVDSTIFQADFCKALLRNCSSLSPQMWMFMNSTASACLSYVTLDCFINQSSFGSLGNGSGLPCPRECPCYKDLAFGDTMSFDSLGNSLPCPKIDMNLTLSTARNETSSAQVFEASSVIGTCNRFAKYLDTWARQSDSMKQKIISFLSNPLDPNITYQDIDQMPLAAFAVANKSLWRDVLMLATDRQKLSIQMKIMMSNDCEVQSMLKGLNFTDLYLKSQSKGEVDSTIFQADFCKALLRNCSSLSPQMWMFMNSTASACLSYVTLDCFINQSSFGSLGNSSGLPCPRECPCYKDLAFGDTMSFDSLGNSLPCPKIDMNLTLSTARNETSTVQVFEASSVIGTCNRFAKYLDTWARQSDAMKQKIISFLSNPLDPNITYQDVDQMPLAAFAVANKSLWRDVLMLATDRQKLSIQMKIMMSNDCEVQSMLKGLNFTELYLSSESKGEVDSTIFQADLCKAFLRNCSNLPTEMWKFLNNTASVCLSYVSPNCTKSLDISKNMSEFSRLFMSTTSMPPFRNSSDLSRLFMSTTSMPPFRNSSDLSRLFMSTTSMPPFRNSSDLSRLFMSTTSMPPFRNSSDLSRPFMSTTSMPPFRNSSDLSRPFMSTTSMPPFRNSSDLSRLFMSTTSMPPFRNSSDLSRLFMSTTSMPPFRNSSDLSRLFMSTTSMPPFRNSSNPSLPGTSPQAPLLTSAPPLVNTGIQTITGEIPPPGYSPVLFSGCDASVEGLRCPGSCPNCYNDKLANDCYSYDKYGYFLGCRSFASNVTMMSALNETTIAKVFNATAEIGTCSRLAKYLRKWINTDSTTKAKSIQFLKNPQSVSDNDVQRIPIEVFAVANKTLLDNVTQMASSLQKLYLATAASLSRSCRIQDHLKSFDLEQSYKDAFQAGSVSSTHFNSSLCKAYMAGQCNISMSKWQFAVDNAQECIIDKAVCLQDVKDSTLDSLLSVSSIRQLCNRTDIDETSQDLFRNRLNAYLGNKTTFTCDQDFLTVISECELDPEFVIKFCNRTKITLFTPTEDQADEWNVVKADALSDAHIDFSTLDKATIVSYLPIPKSMMKSFDLSTFMKVKDAVCSDNILRNDVFSDEDIRDVMDVLLNKGVLNRTSDKDCLAEYAPSEVADSMTASELNQKFEQGTLQISQLTPTQSKKIMDEVKSQIGTSEANLKKYADVIVRHDSETLKSFKGTLSEDTKKTVLEKVKKLAEDANPSILSAAVEACFDDSQPEQSLKTIMSESSEDMMSFLPVKKIDSIPTSAFSSFCGSEKLTDVPQKLGKVFMDKCQDLGTQLDPTIVSNIQSIIGSAPKKVFDSVDTNNADCATIFSLIAESKTVTSEKYEYVCQKLHTCLASSNVDLPDASTLSGNALACFNKTMLKSLQGSCADITTKICSADFSLLDGKSRKTDIKEYVTECLTVPSTITEAHVNAIGNCVELFGSTEIAKMDKSATEKAISALSGGDGRIMCWTKIEKYIERYSAVKGSSILKSKDIISKFNDWTIGLATADLSSISGLCDTLSTIGKSLKKRGTIKKALQKAGLFTECQEDIEAIKTEIKKYITTTLASCSASRRRKRNTASITCAQITNMGASVLSSLSTSQLSGIQDADFTQCVNLLGSPTDYSTEQKEALVQVAKRPTVYGDPSTWSSSTIQSLGSINQGLTDSELNTMTFSFDDIARLGAFSGWGDSQKTTIFSKWSKSSTISSITSSELRSLGHMTCAMTTSQIQQITTSVYGDSADKIGEVTSCSDTQMVEFANHAKTVFGSNVYNWTTVQITSVGVHIGGLSKTEIATLSDTQIDEVLASHITLIPDSVFPGFTSTQLRNFSPAQAQASTSTQRSTLDSSQLSALESAAGVSFSSSSGVDRIAQVSWLVLLWSSLLVLVL